MTLCSGLKKNNIQNAKVQQLKTVSVPTSLIQCVIINDPIMTKEFIKPIR